MERPGLRVARLPVHLALGLGLAAALIVARVRAQEPTAAQTWAARLEAARKSGDVGGLMRSMAGEAGQHTRKDSDFANTYVAVSLDALSALGYAGESIEQQRAVYRDCAAATAAFGSPSQQAEMAFIWSDALANAQLFDEAERIVASALARADLDGDSRVYLLVHSAELAQHLGKIEEALARLARAETAIAGMRDETLPRSAALCDIELARAQIEMDLGRAELGFARLQRTRDEPAAQADPELATRIALLLGAWTSAIESPDMLPEFVTDDVVERARRNYPQHYVEALVERAAALSDMARTAHQSNPEATAMLEHALKVPGISPRYVLAARMMLADLDLRRGDTKSASSRLAAVDAQTVETPELATQLSACRTAIALAEHAPAETLRARADELGASLSKFLVSIRALPPTKGGLGFLLWGSLRTGFSEWARVQMELDPGQAGIARALEPILEAQALGTLARSLNATATLDDVRQHLVSSDCGVLVFLPAPDRSHVFVIGPGGLYHATLSGQNELWRQASALESAWTATPAADGRDAAQRRSALEDTARKATDAFLPADVRQRIASWSCCILVGTELCTNPAFECLVLDDGHFLGLEKSLVYLSSLSVGVALRNRAERRARSTDGLELMLVAEPEPDAELAAGRPPIDLQASALDALIAPFDANRVERRMGSRATLAALREPQVRSARVLSILAHGAYDFEHCGGSERPAFLILSADGTNSGAVCCADVEQLALPQLVELLACGAARGPFRMGDGAAGHLVGACITGGADLVLAARTDLELDSTVELSTRFHEHLRRDGLSPAQALLRARQELAAEPQRADPWYWAGLMLYGDAHMPLFEPASQVERASLTGGALWKYSALAGVVIAASALLVLRRIRTARRRIG